MTFILSPLTSRVRFAGMAAVCAGLLLWWSCDENPVLSALSGGKWVLEADTIFGITDTTYQRARNIGGSSTLYAGRIVQLEQAREVGALLRFGDVDSTQLANLDSARLLIFRRSFEGSPEPPTGAFTLERIISAGDTIWFESDTVKALDDFTLTDSIYSAVMDSDSVLVFTGSQATAQVMAYYLEFAVGWKLLEEWRSGALPNNGFLLRAPVGSDLVSFYSSESTRRPYLVVYYGDITETGGDTTKISYYLMAQDISVYPPLDSDIPEAGRLLLNRSDGHRVHLDFSDTLKARAVSDSLAGRDPRPIAGGRLVFNVDESATMMQAGTMALQVWLRSRPIADSDTGMTSYATFSYQANSDSLVINLTSLLVDYQNDLRENHGLDLGVIASNHDFDRLTLFDPRLEIIYAVPFGAGQ